MDQEFKFTSSEETAEYLISKRYTTVDDFVNANQGFSFYETYLKLFRKKVARCPIMGMTDGSIYVLFDKEKADHRQLMSLLVEEGYKQDDISFTTSLETFSKDDANRDYPLKMTCKSGIIFMGMGSDTYEPSFTSQGQELLSDAFQKHTDFIGLRSS